MTNPYNSNYKQKSGNLKRKEKERRELEKCKSDKKQKVLGDFFNQFESSPITIPDASQNVDKKNLLTTRKSVSNISSSRVGCTFDSFVLNIHKTNVQDSSSDFSLNKPILSLHCTANEPKLNLNNSEIIQNSKTSFVKDKIVEIENILPETTARVTDSSTKSNVQNEYFPDDKALFDNILLSEQKKTDLIYLGPCPPTQSEIIEKEFPKIMNKNERQYASDSKFYFYINKKDKLSESYKSSWLAYSPRNHYAYCHFCWIFGDNEAKKSSWYRGFTDWKHFKDSYSAHAQSKMHLRSSIATFNFKKLKDIKSSLSNQIDDEVKKWKEILIILFDTVRTLCASGLPLRSHRENIGIPGNHGIYLNIIDLISRHNSTLSSHLNSNSKIKYLSKTITNEVLETLALETKSLIIKQCKKAKFFTLLADSTTDVAHLEQMAILLRYVQIDPECEQSIVIKESFIGFYSMNKGDAERFDGANVMLGKHGGLQAKLNEFLGEEIYAPYVHCAAHQLNLVLVHAAENNANASIKVFFATLQKIYNYFSKSHSRWKLFLNQTKMNSHNMNMNSIVVENEMDSGISDITSSNNTNKDSFKTLKSLSTTRWAARLHAVEAMLHNFSTVINCLNIISSEHQASVEASKTMECALKKLKLMRSEKYYTDLIIRAKENWEKMGLLDNEFPETHIRRVKSMAGEVARDIGHSAREKYRLGYFQACDNMINELEIRTTNFTSLHKLFDFLQPSKLKDITNDEMFLTLPISTASAERSMSSLKKIKDYRRSTLSEDRLNDYAMLYIERDTAELIDLQSTIKIFSEKKARKGYKSELL
ncbi:hypothetical protein QTP88_003789 [Uroleucon formosanum]